MSAWDLLFRIGANGAGFRKAMAEAGSNARRAGVDVKNSFSGAERMFGMATNKVMGFAAALGVGFSLDKIRDTVGEVAKIGDSADRVGLTVEQFQQMGYAASQTGVDVGTMTDGLRQFVKLVGEAAGGANNDFTRVLTANGVALRDSNGQMRGQMALLSDYADLIRNAKNEQDAIRLAVIAFGEQAGAMVNTLRGGSEGLDKMAKSASELGLVLTNDTVRAAQELDGKFNEIISKMGAAWKGFVVAVFNDISDFRDRLQGIDSRIQGPAREALLLAQRRKKIEEEIASLQDSKARGVWRPFGDYDEAITRRKTELQTVMEMQERLANNVGSLPGSKPAGKTDIPSTEDQDRVKAAQKVIEALTLQYDAIGKTNLQKQIALELSKAQTTADTEQGQKIIELVTALSSADDAIQAVSDRMEDLRWRQDAAKEGFRFIGDEAEDALTSILDRSQSASQALKQLAIDLAIAAAKALLLDEGPLAGLFKSMSTPSLSSASDAALAGAAGGAHLAGGGRVFGPGGPTSDSIPARLSNGEFVTNAAATRDWLPLLESINSGKMPKLGSMSGQSGGGSGTAISYSPTIHAPGATAETVEALKRVIEEDRRNFAKNVAAVYSDGRSRRAPGFRG